MACAAPPNNNRLFTWGANNYGQLAVGYTTTTDSLYPIQPNFFGDWEYVYCARRSWGASLKVDGTLWLWGHNDYGQLGTNDTIDRYLPTLVNSDTDWADVALGLQWTLAIKQNGTLWAWGKGNQLGTGSSTDYYYPVQIGVGTNWSKVAAGDTHSLGLKTDGTLWAWGSNNYGQLGNNNVPFNELAPVQVGTDTNWASVACGGYHSLAIKTNGTIWSWGRNDVGALGQGDQTDRPIPTQVLYPIGHPLYGQNSDWSKVEGGGFFTLAIKTNGSLWAWGQGGNGQLGQGNNDNYLIPVVVGTETNWDKIACGAYHSLAIKTNNTLWAWGENGNGQLGVGTTSNIATPTQVGVETTWTDVSGSGETEFSMGVLS